MVTYHICKKPKTHMHWIMKPTNLICIMAWNGSIRRWNWTLSVVFTLRKPYKCLTRAERGQKVFFCNFGMYVVNKCWKSLCKRFSNKIRTCPTSKFTNHERIRVSLHFRKAFRSNFSKKLEIFKFYVKLYYRKVDFSQNFN